MMLFCVRPGQARLACIEPTLSHVKDPSSNFFFPPCLCCCSPSYLIRVRQREPGVLQPSFLENVGGGQLSLFSHPPASLTLRDLGSFNILQRAHQKRITASSVANSPMVSTDHDAMSDGDHHL